MSNKLYQIICDICQWQWNTEVYYKNRYIDVKNNFNRISYHSLQDYFELYQAELQFRNFLKFSKDLTLILNNRR